MKENLCNSMLKGHSAKDVLWYLLIGSYFGEKIRLTTLPLQLYLDHRRVSTFLYTATKYIPNAAFNSVMTEIMQC